MIFGPHYRKQGCPDYWTGSPDHGNGIYVRTSLAKSLMIAF